MLRNYAPRRQNITNKLGKASKTDSCKILVQT